MRRICKLPTKWPQETVILLRVLLKHTGRHLWLLDLIRLSIIWTWLVLDQVSVLRTHKDLLTEPLRAIISPLELIVVVSLLLENEVSQTPRNCHIHTQMLAVFYLCHSWLSEKKRNEEMTPTCKYNVHFFIQELPTTLLVSNDFCPALPPRLPNQSNMAFISPVPPALP